MNCPKCGTKCEADFVDNGVGMQQCGPWVCLPDNGGCGWAENDLNSSNIMNVKSLLCREVVENLIDLIKLTVLVICALLVLVLCSPLLLFNKYIFVQNIIVLWLTLLVKLEKFLKLDLPMEENLE